MRILLVITELKNCVQLSSLRGHKGKMDTVSQVFTLVAQIGVCVVKAAHNGQE